MPKEQFINLKLPMRQIARLSREYKIVITHGNSPISETRINNTECDAVVIATSIDLNRIIKID